MKMNGRRGSEHRRSEFHLSPFLSSPHKPLLEPSTQPELKAQFLQKRGSDLANSIRNSSLPFSGYETSTIRCHDRVQFLEKIGKLCLQSKLEATVRASEITRRNSSHDINKTNATLDSLSVQTKPKYRPGASTSTDEVLSVEVRHCVAKPGTGSCLDSREVDSTKRLKLKKDRKFSVSNISNGSASEAVYHVSKVTENAQKSAYDNIMNESRESELSLPQRRKIMRDDERMINETDKPPSLFVQGIMKKQSSGSCSSVLSKRTMSTADSTIGEVSVDSSRSPCSSSDNVNKVQKCSESDKFGRNLVHSKSQDRRSCNAKNLSYQCQPCALPPLPFSSFAKPISSQFNNLNPLSPSTSLKQVTFATKDEIKLLFR